MPDLQQAMLFQHSYVGLRSEMRPQRPANLLPPLFSHLFMKQTFATASSKGSSELGPRSTSGHQPTSRKGKEDQQFAIKKERCSAEIIHPPNSFFHSHTWPPQVVPRWHLSILGGRSNFMNRHDNHDMFCTEKTKGLCTGKKITMFLSFWNPSPTLARRPLGSRAR